MYLLQSLSDHFNCQKSAEIVLHELQYAFWTKSYWRYWWDWILDLERNIAYWFYKIDLFSAQIAFLQICINASLYAGPRYGMADYILSLSTISKSML